MNEQDSENLITSVIQLPDPVKILIVHDVFGGATMDWVPSVKATLESAGHVVITPALPTGLLASYTLWKSALINTLNQIPPGSIFIGHGIGGNILLSLMSEKAYDPSVLILVNTPFSSPEHAGYRKLSQSFFIEPVLWEQINKQTGQIYTLYSTNDPFVSISSGEQFHEKLGSSFLKIGEKGHATSADSIDDLPEVVDIVKQYDQKIIDSLAAISQAEKELRDTRLVAANTPGLHTMQTDIAKISQQNISTVGSGLLRQARKEEVIDYKNSIKNPQNIFYIILAVLFLSFGAFGLGTGTIKLIPETATVFFKSANPSEKSIIVIDSLEKPIEIGNQSIEDIYKKISDIGNNYQSSSYSIIGIPVTDNGKPATIPGYLKPIASKLSPELAVIGNQPVFYGISLHPKPSPFMIITLPSYDAGYNVMKSWNKSIVRDIGIWMMIDPVAIKNTFGSFDARENIIANNLVTTLFSSSENNNSVDQSPENNEKPSEITTVDEAAYIVESSETPDTNSTEAALIVEPTEQVSVDNEQVISWMFMDEQTLLIVRDKKDIPEILKRFQEKKGITGGQ